MPEGPSQPQPAKDAWYPEPQHYYVPANEAAQYPLRFGDLFNVPEADALQQPLVTPKGTPWHAALALSPSCELVNKAKPTDTIEIAHVVPLSTQDPAAQARIITGWQEKEGRVVVAFAHTVFYGPVPCHPTHGDPMFANLKDTRRVRFADLEAAGRIAALTHDTRIAVIRRDLYFRYRWVVPMTEVKNLEAERVSGDPKFGGPRPEWAPAPDPA